MYLQAESHKYLEWKWFRTLELTGFLIKDYKGGDGNNIRKLSHTVG